MKTKKNNVITPENAEEFFRSNSGEGQHTYRCRLIKDFNRTQNGIQEEFSLVFKIEWGDSFRLIVLICDMDYEIEFDRVYSRLFDYYEDEKTHGLRWRPKSNLPDFSISGDFRLEDTPFCSVYCDKECDKCASNGALMCRLTNEKQVKKHRR